MFQDLLGFIYVEINSAYKYLRFISTYGNWNKEMAFLIHIICWIYGFIYVVYELFLE